MKRDEPLDLSKKKEQRRVKLILINLLSDPNTIIQSILMPPPENDLIEIEFKYYKNEKTKKY